MSPLPRIETASEVMSTVVRHRRWETR
jgi:hypothetical protein